MRRRSSLRFALVLLGVAVAVVLVLAGRDAWRIKSRLEAGQSRVGDLDLESASAPGGLKAAADDAATDLERADRLARDSTWLGLLDRVPLLGSQVDGLRELTASTAELGGLARTAADQVQTALDAASGNPAGRVTLLEVASQQVATVSARLADMHPAAGRFLVPPLSGARDHLDAKLREATTKLADATRSLAALHRFLVGPTRVLVLAANNAEMTAGSGMPNSGGVATVANGDIDLGEFVQNDRTYLQGTPGLTAPGDLQRLYANIGIGYDFRGTTGTPNFPVVAPLMRDMAAQAPLFGPVDGVVVVDAFVVRDLLTITGPVDVDGVTYDSTNLMQSVLNDNYLRFGDITADRGARADLQGAIARAAFDAMKTRKAPLASIVKVLSDDAKGRHVLAWSADPDLEKVFHDIGADGSLTGDGLMVSLENLGGDKLDWYLKPRLEITVSRGAGDVYLVTMALTVSNDPRSPTTEQVEGLRPDRHFVMPDLHVPLSALALSSSDVPFKAIGLDPPMQAANLIDSVPLGETKTWHFGFGLPAGQKTLRILPSARVTPLAITVNGYPTDDAVARVVDLPRLVPPTKHVDGWVVATSVVALAGFGFALNAMRRRGGAPVFTALPVEGPPSKALLSAVNATWLLTGAAVVLLLHVLWSAR